MKSRKKVLIAPLNWGLGHATRCISIIKAFEEKGCEVVIASDGDPLTLLKSEFPHLKSYELPSYDISYSKRLSMGVSIALQMPKILRNINRESRRVREIHKKEKFDIIVSDCRFGCFLHGIDNVYITHQVLIKFPKSLEVLEPLGVYFHKLVWRKFTKVWVVDRFGDDSLSGKLGFPVIHKKLVPIGISTRFTESLYGNISTKYAVVFILSGPEPYRTLLEKKIESEQWPEDKQYCLIRGLPNAKEQLQWGSNWDIFNHLNSADFLEKLSQSEKIVSRSGYSTVMDLARLGRSAFYIPTPGQPEQEYLAAYLGEKMGNSFQEQEAPSLSKAILNNCSINNKNYDPVVDRELLNRAMEKILYEENGE